MKDIKKSLTKYLSLVLIIILSALTLLYFLGFFKTVSYPFDIEQGEGYTLRPAIYLSQGKLDIIYKKVLEKPQFVYCEYPPIFLIVQAALFSIFGKTFAAGRVVSFISSLLTAFLIYKIVRGRSPNRKFPLISSLLFLSSNIALYWGLIARVDMLAMFFTALGVYFLTFRRNRKSTVLSALFFLLAVFTKQNFLAAPLAAAVFLFVKNRKEGAEFSLAFLSFSSITFLLLNFLTGWDFLLNIFSYNIKGIGVLPLQLRRNSKIFLKTSFIPIGIGIYYFFKKRKFFSIYLLTSLVMGLIFSLRPEGWSNYFLEFLFSSSIVIGLLLASLRREGKDLRSLIFLSLIILSIPVQLYFGSDIRMNILDGDLEYINRHDDQIIYSLVKGSEDPVLIENIGYTIKAGNYGVPELLGIKELVSSSQINNKKVKEYCQSGNFSYIIYRNPSKLPSGIKKCIELNYSFTQTGLKWYSWFGKEKFWKVYRLKGL